MKIVVFTGAGVSAESGISTFRDNGGLWDKYRIEDVATPEAFARNPALVLDFYNMRYAQLGKVQPNAAHHAIARLEKMHDVVVITQNVDNLHERAGSGKVLHLHGELSKCRSSGNQGDIYPMPKKGLKVGDLCSNGHQLRPHIVWFGELVPAMDEAFELVKEADILLIVGTSLQVYPAAGLAYAAMTHTKIFIVDPAEVPDMFDRQVSHIKTGAAEGVSRLVDQWMNE